MIAGALELQLYTDVARIKSDMGSAQSIIGSSLSAIDKQVGLVKSALGGLVAGLSVAALANFIKGAIEGAARLHDLSIQAGMTVEALSGLQVVGKATGTAADQIAAASNKLSKALATSNEESKGAAAALKALGLNFDTLQKMSPDQRMQAIAVAMNQFQDGGQKSAAAMLLFGKAGAELLPFLKDLATAGELHAKITEQQAEAAHQFERNLGQLKVAAEAWKKQLAMELLPTLNDVVDVMLTLKGTSDKVGSSLFGETVITVLQTLAVLGVNFLYILKQIGNEVGGIVAQFQALIKLDFSSFWKSLQSIATVLNPAAQAAALLRGDWAAFREISELMKTDAQNARVEVDKLSSSLLGLTNSRAGAGRGFVNPALLGAIPNKPELTGLAGDPNAENTKKYDALIRGIKEKIAADKLYVASGRELTEFEKFESKTLTELNDASLKFTATQKAGGVAELQRLKQADDAANILKADQQSNANYAKDWAKTEADLAAAEAFNNAARGKVSMATYEETRALKDYGEQLVLERSLIGASDAQRSIALDNLRVEIKLRNDLDALDREAGLNDETRAKRRTALNDNAATAKQFNEFKAQTDEMSKFWGKSFSGMEDALVNFVQTGKLTFSSLIDSMIGDLARMFIHQSVTTPLFNMLSGSGIMSSITSLFGFGGTKAIGGAVNSGMSYLVGERGPEVFTPNSSGNITPNGQSGGGDTYHYHFTVGDVATVSVVKQAIAQSESRTQGALYRSRQYGGAMAQ